MGRGGIKLNPKFKDILKTDKKYILLTGGRGSQKSFTTASLIEDLTFYQSSHILYSRYTMTAAHISIIPEFTDKIEKAGDDAFFSVTAKDITNNVTGSKILFRGIKTSSGNQTANLKSIQGLSTFVVDEAEEFTNEDDFDTIDYSIRQKGVKNMVFLIMNPSTHEHWIYKRWFEGHSKQVMIDGHSITMSTHPDVLHIHSTYLDNLKHLSKSFIKSAEKLKENNPDKYIHLMLGGWREKAKGVIFNNWIEGEFNDRLPYCYGMDYGFIDPLALIKIAVDERNKKIYWKETIYQSELGVDEMIRIMKSRVRMNDLIMDDHNEMRTRRALKKAGFNIHKAKKLAIKDRIRAMSDYQHIIDPDSHNVKKEFNNYRWNDKRAEIPIDDFNHAMDAGAYAYTKLSAPKIII